MNRNNFPILIRLQVINNKNGDIIKFISKKNQYFKGFGEIYFLKLKKITQKDGEFIKKITHY